MKQTHTDVDTLFDSIGNFFAVVLEHPKTTAFAMSAIARQVRTVLEAPDDIIKTTIPPSPAGVPPIDLDDWKATAAAMQAVLLALQARCMAAEQTMH